jgi:hypothetical protein
MYTKFHFPYINTRNSITRISDGASMVLTTAELGKNVFAMILHLRIKLDVMIVCALLCPIFRFGILKKVNQTR